MSRPTDVPGECNAWLLLADDFGDNDCTFRCQLPTGHHDGHKAYFGPEGRVVKVSWEYDQRPELEAEDEAQRGYHDGHYDEPPGEPGEPYLAGYCQALEEIDDEADTEYDATKVLT